MSGVQPASVDVPVYLLVEPTWGDRRRSWERDDQDRPILLGAKVTKATQGRPTVPRDGGVVMRLTLRVPAGAFLPLQPEAVVVVSMNDLETVMVEAVDPRDGEPDG